MVKVVKFEGRGSIEFGIPSRANTIVLKSNEEIELKNITDKDVKVLKSLRTLQLVILDKKVKNQNTGSEEPQNTGSEEPQNTGSEEPQNTGSEEPQYTTKSLMSKNATELKKTAKDLGVDFPEGASKAEITALIMKKLEG